MKLPAQFLSALLAISVAASAIAQEPAKSTPPAAPTEAKSGTDVYVTLRSVFLAGSRKVFNLPATTNPKEPWGVLMDIGMPGGPVSVVALLDGNASIYLGNGASSIGGVDHEIIRKAAVDVVKMALRYQPHIAATKSFPVPKTGETTFYLLTDAGIYTATAPSKDLEGGKHFLSALYYAGQAIITQYRIVEEKGENK